MGRLDVRIVEARNLPDLQWIGKPDPYVVVRFEGQKQRTRYAPDTIHPKWDTVFKFVVADENSSQIHIEIWNKNLISDDLMATYSLSVSGLIRGEVKDKWYVIQSPYRRCNPEVRIRLCATDFGMSLPPNLCGSWLAEQGYLDRATSGAAGVAPFTPTNPLDRTIQTPLYDVPPTPCNNQEPQQQRAQQQRAQAPIAIAPQQPQYNPAVPVNQQYQQQQQGPNYAPPYPYPNQNMQPPMMQAPQGYAQPQNIQPHQGGYNPQQPMPVVYGHGPAHPSLWNAPTQEGPAEGVVLEQVPPLVDSKEQPKSIKCAA